MAESRLVSQSEQMASQSVRNWLEIFRSITLYLPKINSTQKNQLFCVKWGSLRHVESFREKNTKKMIILDPIERRRHHPWIQDADVSDQDKRWHPGASGPAGGWWINSSFKTFSHSQLVSRQKERINFDGLQINWTCTVCKTGNVKYKNCTKSLSISLLKDFKRNCN